MAHLAFQRLVGSCRELADRILLSLLNPFAPLFRNYSLSRQYRFMPPPEPLPQRTSVVSDPFPLLINPEVVEAELGIFSPRALTTFTPVHFCSFLMQTKFVLLISIKN